MADDTIPTSTGKDSKVTVASGTNNTQRNYSKDSTASYSGNSKINESTKTKVPTEKPKKG